ncbi:cytochrome c oxidase subunit I [Orrella sp. JC864]|uniref:cytochrome c oxidase subunit I n=1 Tax=Orrella sp. JC864 TaxID=3120298 RepID=UPI0012BCCA2A
MSVPPSAPPARAGHGAARLSALARHRRLAQIWGCPPGWRRLSNVNHSDIGARFMATALLFFLVGGVLAMLIRAQLATSDAAFLDAGLYNQVFTMHGTVMMFLFAIPMLEGLALYLLPKILGARDLAYPRLGVYAYWCYLFGGLILLGGMAAGVAPDSGWFMYTPLSGATYTPGINADVWLIGVTFAEISAICGAVELVVTILSQRTAGMGIARMPIFAWYILVTAMMILVGFPPLILGSILLEIERAFGWPFFEVAKGGDPLLWQHLFWMFGHPEVYIIFLPAAGLVSTMVPVFARRPLLGYEWLVGSVVVIGFLSFGLWVHHMFTVGIPHLALAFFSAASMLVAVPTGVQFFAWIATLWAGRPVFRLPMLYLAGFLFIFVAGGLTGVMLAFVPFNWQVHDTHFVVAHLHYVLVGGMVFPVIAAIYHWMPHFTGRMPSELLGKWAFWLIFIGFNVAFLVMHLTGLLGMPRRVYTYPGELGWDLWNLISSVGGFVMAIGVGLLLMDLLLHARQGRRAGRDPWGAGTLEWAMPIPATTYNFGSQAHVHGREPLWDTPGLGGELAAGRGYLSEPNGTQRETLAVSLMGGQPIHVVVVPGNSWLPLCAALATAVFFLCVLFKLYALALAGAAAALAVFWAWAWQSGLRHDPAPREVGMGLVLNTHHVSPTAPGWRGTVFALLADGTLLASLLFGYGFLWTIAPGWPPPAYIESGGWLAWCAVLAAAAAAFAAWRARAPAVAGLPRACTGWAGAGAASAALATGLLLALARTAYPDPTEHAYGAVVNVMAAYLAVHTFAAALMGAFVALRARAGYVSAQRRLEPRVWALWCGYTAVAAVLVLGATYVPLEMLP